MPGAGWRACTKRHAVNSELDKPAQRFWNLQRARGETMPNDHIPGPSRLASSIEIASLVQAHGITRDQARRLVNRFGNNRAKLSEAGRTLKARLAAATREAASLLGGICRVGREELETTSMDARTPLQPAVVTPKQALSIKPFGLDMDVLLTTEATGGATSVIVAWHKPGEGPPDHVHFKQEEILFIIEGLYEVTVGDETAKAGPGSIVFIPRNVVHRFKNVGSITGRMLGWSLPGGQDHYL